MAVNIQAGSIAEWTGTIGASPLYHDLSVTVASGSDLAIFLILSKNGTDINNGPGGGYFETPTVDGAAMTLVDKTGGIANNCSGVWVYLAPSVGAHTVRAIVNTWSGAGAKLTAFAADGVDQTTPTGTVVKYSTGSSSSPRSDSCTVAAGGVAIAAHGINSTTLAITPGAGQTAFGAATTYSGNEFVHTYKASATSMGYSWSSGSPQNHQIIVPINAAAASPTTATLTGPTTGTTGSASSNFTVTLDVAAASTVTITPAGTTGTVTFTPSSPTITAGNTSTTFTANADTDGAHSISITTSPALTYSGSPITYTTSPGGGSTKAATTYYAHMLRGS